MFRANLRSISGPLRRNGPFSLSCRAVGLRQFHRTPAHWSLDTAPNQEPIDDSMNILAISKPKKVWIHPQSRRRPLSALPRILRDPAKRSDFGNQWSQFIKTEQYRARALRNHKELQDIWDQDPNPEKKIIIDLRQAFSYAIRVSQQQNNRLTLAAIWARKELGALDPSVKTQDFDSWSAAEDCLRAWEDRAHEQRSYIEESRKQYMELPLPAGASNLKYLKDNGRKLGGRLKPRKPKKPAELAPDTTKDTATQILESRPAESAKGAEGAEGDRKEPTEFSPDTKEDIATQILDGSSAESAESAEGAEGDRKEPTEFSPGTKEDIATQILDGSSANNAESEPKESAEFCLDPNEDIVAQILEGSAKYAPPLPVEESQPVLRDSNKESLKHIAKYVEEKHVGKLTLPESKLVALDAPMPPVPGVSFGLDRVLFNPGVYHLRDPRSRVYNFDPYLGEIMPVSEFDYGTLKPYITSSKDETALKLAMTHKKKYYGSSSSMTSVLSHFHYLLSSWRPINIRQMSSGFPDDMRNFTRILRAPTAMFLRYKEEEDSYAIDADKEYDSANILTNLGKSMEKLLTLPKEEFERYRRSSPNKVTAEEENNVPESYHYTTAGKFMMRSQLDAYDPRLPGTGMYDLKTRAVTSIRMDVRNHDNGIGYEIKDRFGNYESYEREYFDMMRAAFLKYSLQVRIGRMDGIFVAYHNIERIFGFQYISLPEMDDSLHGTSDTTLGDREFEFSLGLWEEILDKATAKFPKQSLRLHFETRAGTPPFMYIFAEPVTDKQINAIQTSRQAEIDEFNDRLFNPDQSLSRVMDLGAAPPTEDVPVVEESPAKEPAATEDEKSDELLAMTLVIKNKVNGEIVPCPQKLRAPDDWEVYYELNELATVQGRVLLQSLKNRRRDIWTKLDEGDSDSNPTRDRFLQTLQRYVRRGRRFREREQQRDSQEGIVWYEESQKKSA